MSWRDYCEPGPWDDDEPEDVVTTCKYCGTTNLCWVELKEGWRLANSDGDIHACQRPKSSPADDFGPTPTTCQYTEGKTDGWGTNWTTACGQSIRIESPTEVGFSFAPPPNADGKFCPHCGKLIKL